MQMPSSMRPSSPHRRPRQHELCMGRDRLALLIGVDGLKPTTTAPGTTSSTPNPQPAALPVKDSPHRRKINTPLYSTFTFKCSKSPTTHADINPASVTNCAGIYSAAILLSRPPPQRQIHIRYILHKRHPRPGQLKVIAQRCHLSITYSRVHEDLKMPSQLQTPAGAAKTPAAHHHHETNSASLASSSPTRKCQTQLGSSCKLPADICKPAQPTFCACLHHV